MSFNPVTKSFLAKLNWKQFSAIIKRFSWLVHRRKLEYIFKQISLYGKFIYLSNKAHSITIKETKIKTIGSKKAHNDSVLSAKIFLHKNCCIFDFTIGNLPCLVNIQNFFILGISLFVYSFASYKQHPNFAQTLCLLFYKI